MKKRLFISGIVLVCVLVFGLSFSSYAGDTQRKLEGESAINAIAKRGVIKVGMDIFVPWAMKDKKGELIGFEIDIAKKLAEDMGVKVEFVPTKWSGIIPGLITGKFDVLIGGMTITTKRNMKIINREIEVAPDDLYWKYHRAASLTLLGEYDDAIVDYEAVIADPPASLHWDIYIYQAHTGLVHLDPHYR